jgi:glycosyltransferase involved in cell wall biosynthesis
LSSVLFDLTGTQSLDHRDRGIARYVFELALAVEEVAPGRISAFLVNADLALPGDLERLVATGRLLPSDEASFDRGTLLHITSPYELSVPLRRLFPEAAQAAGGPVVVTLYDLIPEVLADPYLADPGLRQRYRARHHLVRSADAVLTLSEATRRDAVHRLGLSPDRVSVAGAGTSARFVPPSSRALAGAAAADALPGVRPPFVLYTGGTDERKNVDRLLQAWARLPAGVRRRYQLVVACGLKPLERNHFEVLAGRLGLDVGADLALPGFVPDEALVLLYQGTDLFVYPSLYEGYGLPVAEALACGAPVAASDRASLSELVEPPGLFDPLDPAAMAAVIEAALTDTGIRATLRARAGRPPTTWAEVARRTVAAYDSVSRHRTAPRRRRRRERMRIAFATPLPPQPSGVADYSARLLDELRHHAEVHALVDGPPHHRAEQRAPVAPPGVEVHPVSALGRVEAVDGRFDAVVYSLGNSEFHTGALAALRRRPGVVLAHDVRLTDLYGFGPHQHPGAVPGGLAAAVQRIYGGRVPEDLGASGWLAPAEADRWGLLMAREVIALSERFLASSPFAAALARLDAAPADRDKVSVLPLALGVHAADPPADPARPGAPVVATFGLVNALKQTALVLEAFAAVAAARPDATLAVVGPCSDTDRSRLTGRVESLGLTARVLLTGRVGEEEYRRWLARATVAVQLRSSTNGETSGAVGACLASAVPTVVTGLGPARDLPDEAVVKVSPAVEAFELGACLTALLADDDRRRALGRAAAAYAAGRSFAAAAEALYRLLADRQALVAR